MYRNKYLAFGCVSLSFGLGAASDVMAAGAWVDRVGSLNVGLSETYTTHGVEVTDQKHNDQKWVGPNGFVFKKKGANELFDPKVSGHTMLLNASYVPVANLGVELSAAYSAVKYGGDQGGTYVPTLEGAEMDNGEYHPGLQDLQMAVSYNVWAPEFGGTSFAVTPIVSGLIPMSDYRSHGHSAIGLGMKQLGTGLALGASGYLTGAFTELKYTYQFVGNVAEVDEYFEKSDLFGEALGNNRSQVDFSTGYLVLPELSIVGNVSYENVHGGWTHSDLFSGDTPIGAAWMPGTPTHSEAFFENQAAYLGFHSTKVGLGASYTLANALTINANASWLVRALSMNAAVGGNYTLGLTYNLL